MASNECTLVAGGMVHRIAMSVEEAQEHVRTGAGSGPGGGQRVLVFPAADGQADVDFDHYGNPPLDVRRTARPGIRVDVGTIQAIYR